MIKEQLVRLDSEDDIECVEASLQQVESRERLAGSDLVQAVTQLAQEETNNTSNNLQSGSVTPQQQGIIMRSVGMSDSVSV